jgi:hypothetical protein
MPSALPVTNGEIMVCTTGGVLSFVAAPGTAGNALQSNGTTWTSQGPFASSLATLTASSAYGPFTHGLGYTPTKLWYTLTCQVANAGYSIGDVITQYPSTTATAQANFTMWVNSGGASFGAIINSVSGIAICNKSTGAAAAITNADWKVTFYAQ